MSGLSGNIIASLVSKAWSALLLLALVPVYIRFLGVEAYGVVGAFVALQALMSLLDLGFGATLTRQLARLSAEPHAAREMRDLLRTLEIIYWAVAVGLALLVLLLAPGISSDWLRLEKLSNAEVSRAIAAAGLAFALLWPTNLYSAGLAGLQQQVTLGWIVGGAGTLRALASVLALWLLAPTLEVFFLAQACVNLLQTVCIGAVLWRALPAAAGRSSFRPALVRAVLRFATGMTGISLTTVVLTQLDKAVLSKTLPLGTFGYYTVASTLAAGLYVVVTPLFAAFFPRFSQLAAQQDRAAIGRLYGVSSQLMAVILLPLAAVIALFSPEILGLWTGNPAIVANSGLLLSLLILGNAMNGLMNVPYALQLAHGWTSLAFYSNVAAIALCAPLTYYLSLRMGAPGGALVWVLLTFGYLCTTLPLTLRKLLPGRLWHWYLVDVGGPAIAAFAVAGLGRILLPRPPPGLGTALLLASLTACGWLAAMLAAPDIRALVVNRLHPANTAG